MYPSADDVSDDVSDCVSDDVHVVGAAVGVVPREGVYTIYPPDRAWGLGGVRAHAKDAKTNDTRRGKYVHPGLHQFHEENTTGWE